jgi:hypothetical protein
MTLPALTGWRVTRGVLGVLVLLGGRTVAAPFADQVVAYQIGVEGGAGQDKMPGIVLGPPRGGGAFQGSTDTLSLGLGGWIILEFSDGLMVDAPGPDFTVFENPFLVQGLVTGPPFAEPGTVSVSVDGEQWATFPCHVDEPPYYPGCAGVYPVFADANDPTAPSPLVPCTMPIQALVGISIDSFQSPACSGGDSFDLADVSLPAVRFVRIAASQLQPGAGGTAGFDLDAVAAVHFMPSAPPPVTSTTTSTVSVAASTTSTTTAGLECPAEGLPGALCALERISPATLCGPELSDPGLQRFIASKVHKGRRFLQAAERKAALRVRQRLIREANRELSAIVKRAAQAARAHGRRPPRISAACRAVIDQQTRDLQQRLTVLAT